MVIKAKLPGKLESAALFGPGRARKELAPKRDSFARRDLTVRSCVSTKPAPISDRVQVDVDEAEEGVDVIDLGAPRRLRSAAPDPLPGAGPARARHPPRHYTPNPRLYPGPKPKRRPRSASHAGRPRRRLFHRPVPNARLYRPAPRRLPPPAEPPRGPWPPPAPPVAALDTASRAALRLSAHRPIYAPKPSYTGHPHSAFSRLSSGEAPARPPSPLAPPARRLVVTLPASSRGAGMDAARRSSPDDCSDTDALSAPSEFLAEFLSAIMRRQHAEALKYCRLILQYEPHNATARGFYPLLQHKVQALKQNEGAGAGGGSSSGSSGASGGYSPARRSPPSALSADDSPSAHEGSGGGGVGAEGGSRSRSGSESGGSVASQSSLELDSSSGSAAASDSCSGTRSRSEPDSSDARDDNGNLPASNLPRSDDVENDNDVSHIKSESSASLRRLRAQFACSIK